MGGFWRGYLIGSWAAIAIDELLGAVAHRVADEIADRLGLEDWPKP